MIKRKRERIGEDAYPFKQRRYISPFAILSIYLTMCRLNQYHLIAASSTHGDAYAGSSCARHEVHAHGVVKCRHVRGGAGCVDLLHLLTTRFLPP